MTFTDTCLYVSGQTEPELFTGTRVRVDSQNLRMVAKKTGKRSNFSVEQMAALRVTAERLMRKEGWNATAFAKKLKVEQQSVSTFLGGGGLGYQVATIVAKLAGFSGVDDLFDANAVTDGVSKQQTKYADRSRAMGAKAARVLGVTQLAIEAVDADPAFPIDQIFPSKLLPQQDFKRAKKWAAIYDEMQEALDAEHAAKAQQDADEHQHSSKSA